MLLLSLGALCFALLSSHSVSNLEDYGQHKLCKVISFFLIFGRKPILLPKAYCVEHKLRHSTIYDNPAVVFCRRQEADT